MAFPFTANEPLAKALVDAAQSTEYVPVDLLLSDLAEKLQQNGRFYMIPSIFQNIGIWSTSEKKMRYGKEDGNLDTRFLSKIPGTTNGHGGGAHPMRKWICNLDRAFILDRNSERDRERERERLER